jgi:hypothetical protein
MTREKKKREYHVTRWLALSTTGVVNLCSVSFFPSILGLILISKRATVKRIKGKESPIKHNL